MDWGASSGSSYEVDGRCIGGEPGTGAVPAISRALCTRLQYLIGTCQSITPLRVESGIKLTLLPLRNPAF